MLFSVCSQCVLSVDIAVLMCIDVVVGIRELGFELILLLDVVSCIIKLIICSPHGVVKLRGRCSIRFQLAGARPAGCLFNIVSYMSLVPASCCS